jgi:hypothetical protein
MLYKEWVKLIEAFKVSGKSQAQWCREKNLKVKAFNYQYRKYRKENKTYAPEENKQTGCLSSLSLWFYQS